MPGPAKNVWDSRNANLGPLPPSENRNDWVAVKGDTNVWRRKTSLPAHAGGTPAPKEPAAPQVSSGGGGGGGGSSVRSSGGGGGPSPFTDLNLPSQADIQEQYKDQIARGQAFLEALGHESFRDMISTALAQKFTPPTEFQQFMSGEGTQSVGAPAGQFNQLEIGGPARTALQQGLTTLPPAGGGPKNV